MSGGPTVVKYKLSAATAVEEASPTAAALGALANLSDVRRVFRGGGKHEAAHVKAGLHLWYEGRAADAAAARAAVDALSADARVATAEVEKPVRLAERGL